MNFSIGDIVRCDNLFGLVVLIDETKFDVHWFGDDVPFGYSLAHEWEHIVRA